MRMRPEMSGERMNFGRATAFKAGLATPALTLLALGGGLRLSRP